MIMLGFIFGWPRRIRKLRKRWDRLREKTLKKKGLVKKTALEKLDMIEQKLRTLVEQKITRLDRSRLSRAFLSISQCTSSTRQVRRESPSALSTVPAARCSSTSRSTNFTTIWVREIASSISPRSAG